MESSKRNKIIYWVITIPFVGLMLLSGFAYWTEQPMVIEGITALGYPVYFLKILGTAKFLGGLALLFDRFKTLKEWAYAGFTINLLSASASHYLVGHSQSDIITPLAFLGVLLFSYCLWKSNRATAGR